MKRFLLVLVFAACARPTPVPDAPTAAVVPAVEPTARQQFPLRVSLTEVSRTDSKAVVEAKVERLTGLAFALAVKLDVPAGVTVDSGRSSFSLAANTEADATVERFVLSYAAIPSGDVTLHVDGDGAAMGFHSTQVYRFGRPAPEAATVPATGPAPVGKGGKPAGASVPLK